MFKPMSIFYRRENHREILFEKGINLKKLTNDILEIIPQEYSFADFLQAFKDCYPTVWEDIVNHCKDKKNDFIRRKNKGLRTVPYYSPEEYLRGNCEWNKRRTEILSDEDRKKKYGKLVEKGRKKKKERDARRKEILEKVQIVTPSYVKDMIRTYFQTRKTNTLNVNARYLILLEASQFHSEETIQFLHKIAACEKNNELRDIAYRSLVQLGEHPWKSRKRKGRQKTSHLKQIDLQNNPTELLQLIYDNQQLVYQNYDVFLSHSSLDVRELLDLKYVLNKQNLTVYIDWINDKVMLDRANQDENTWNALELRMRQSKMLLFVITDNSIKSSYTEKEVNYFKNLSRRILVYQPYTLTLPIPKYLEGCEYLDFEQLKNLK